MKRRDFISLLGGTAAIWPLIARAQEPQRIRRIGVLVNVVQGDPVGRARLEAFTHRLAQLGWAEGRNLHLEVRWAGDNNEQYRRYAIELIALRPDVVLAFTSPAVGALQRQSQTVPIVFGGVVDPVGAGFVRSLPRPGRNATGFSLFEYSIGGKWLELLKEIAPAVTRIAVIRDSSIAAGVGQFAAIQAVTPNSLELSVIELNDPRALDESIQSVATNSNSGLLVTASGFGANHPEVIPKLAARYKLPAVYPFRYFIDAGGLVSYGPNLIRDFHQAADYVDRILKGERPAELPVQAPTKYELVINLKIAKALGFTISPSLLARADEVIE